MKEVEYCAGDWGGDEYTVSFWQDHELRPRLDGWTFEAKVARTGYERSIVSRWPWWT